MIDHLGSNMKKVIVRSYIHIKKVSTFKFFVQLKGTRFSPGYVSKYINEKYCSSLLGNISAEITKVVFSDLRKSLSSKI